MKSSATKRCSIGAVALMALLMSSSSFAGRLLDERTKSPYDERATPGHHAPVSAQAEKQVEENGQGQAGPSSGYVASSPSSTASTPWTLTAGALLHEQLEGWAKQAGWTFVWKLPHTWDIPATAQFYGTFEEAMGQVVKSLYNQGKNVRLVIWKGNRLVEINDASN
ncbi:MAG: toxin co-regulated pilus biosynthesis Q family protein [Gammaproteobacteria bacterium]|nr:toxin co-regulated pilus biosynthesis Q family protein [Gammaproteobacteria bacterium]